MMNLQGCMIYGVDCFNGFCFENAEGDLIRIDDFDNGRVSIFEKDSALLSGWVLYRSCGMEGSNPYLDFSKDFTSVIYADSQGLYSLDLTDASAVPEQIYATDVFTEPMSEYQESAFLCGDDPDHFIIAGGDKVVFFDMNSGQERIIAKGELSVVAISRKYGYMICSIEDEAFVVWKDGSMDDWHDIGETLTYLGIKEGEEMVSIWPHVPYFQTVRGNIVFATGSENDDLLRIYRLDEHARPVKITDTAYTVDGMEIWW